MWEQFFAIKTNQRKIDRNAACFLLTYFKKAKNHQQVTIFGMLNIVQKA